MKKVKITKNNKVIAFDFDGNLLKQDRMYRLCEIFALDEIYIDIYGARSRKEDFTKKLLDKASLCVAPIDNTYGLAIKATIKDIPTISAVLSEFDFDDMNIWDCYTGWEKYLEDKATKSPFFTFKKLNVEIDNKFYLNYKESKVEIICDLIYDKKELVAKITDLIN